MRIRARRLPARDATRRILMSALKSEAEKTLRIRRNGSSASRKKSRNNEGSGPSVPKRASAGA